jgi:Ricin-type beta-trefoil lectin domain-like
MNQHSGLCLAVPGGSSHNGLQLIQWTCNGASDQYWNFSQKSKGFLIGNKKTKKVVDIKGASKANNAPAIQWDWKAKTNQMWHH